MPDGTAAGAATALRAPTMLHPVVTPEAEEEKPQPKDPEQVLAQSPLSYVDRIRTPMLLIHSEQDWRCPIEQVQRLYVALKQRKVEVELLLFPGEGHELTRSGLPSHRVARFEAVLDWWRRHLTPR